MIIIYGKPACPSCVKAKQLCEMRGYSYEYQEMGKDFDREFIFEQFPGARTFPQIVVNGEKVGGFEGMTKYIEDTAYTGTGDSL